MESNHSETLKKQKVLLVHNRYKVKGGEDSVVFNEKKLLEEHGHEVVLYERSNEEIERYSIFQKLLFPFSSIYNFRTYREIKKIIKAEGIDVVHVHNTLSVISPSVYYAAKKCKVPVVQTIHNFRLLCPGATFCRDGEICEKCVKGGLHNAVKYKCYRGSRLQSLVAVWIQRFHRMTGIFKKINYICLTDFNKQKLLEHKQIREERVFVKPNFSFGTTEEGVIPVSKRENSYAFVGRLDKLKGVDWLLKQWQNLGENAPKLVVCGDGPLGEQCRAFAKENGLKNVEFLGQVDNETAKSVIAKAKALILPTQWYEGFPMTVVEAYSVGTPVIGPDMGNVGALIEEGVTGKKYPFGADLTREILNVDDLPPVENNFTQEENYKQLINIYRELIK